MARAAIAFATILLLIQCAFAQEKPSIVPSLHRYQAYNGGFKLNEGDSASLEATSYALFLNALYGAYKINPEAALRYVQSLENGDYGYGNTHGATSDLESVRFALLSYSNLKAPIPNSVNVAGYIQSLYHTDSSLFGNRVGTKGDLRSTAHAIQALKTLNVQDGVFLKKITPALHQHLKRIQKETPEGTYFADAAYPALTSNYFGLLIATLTGFDVQNQDKFVSFIASQQSKEGGFYLDNSKKSTSLEATAHAIASLNLLKKAHERLSFEKINVDAAVSFAKKSGSDLKSTSQAHLVAAVLGKALSFSVTYDADTKSGFVDDRIVQGAKVKPVLATSSIVGLVNPALNVQATVTLPSGTKNIKLAYEADRQKYVATESIDSANVLGAATFDYSIQADVAEILNVNSKIVDVKQIGYGVTVAASANLAGKEIREGEAIGVGTEFKFGLSLHNQTHENLNSGEFDVVFSILDSSRSSIHSETLNGRGNKNAISFSYTLKTSALPSGDLYAVFEVRGKEGVHTVKTVTYSLSLMMVASEIAFDGAVKNQAQYKLGDSVKVSFVPGSFPDLRTVHTFKPSETRNFFLDISTPGGVLVHSVRGALDAASKDASKYSFSFVLEPTIENIGNKVLTFRYSPANGKDIVLSNYDSSVKELLEDTPVTITVNAELRAVNFQERPAKGDFFYGNDIVYKFQIKDTKSNKFVTVGNIEAANVFLELKNQQSGKDRISASQAATVYSDAKSQGFLINWNINPNAVRGAGALSIVAHNADGETVTILEEKKDEPVQLNVNIGGDIDFAPSVKTVSLETSVSAFLVDFTLKCQGKTLKDAQLRSVVSFRASADDTFTEFARVPVATNENGSYEASLTVPHARAQTGEYKFAFYREVDKDADKPLFEISANHQAVPTGQLPIKTEFFVALVLGAAFAAITYKKSKY